MGVRPGMRGALFLARSCACGGSNGGQAPCSARAATKRVEEAAWGRVQGAVCAQVRRARRRARVRRATHSLMTALRAVAMSPQPTPAGAVSVSNASTHGDSLDTLRHVSEPTASGAYAHAPRIRVSQFLSVRQVSPPSQCIP